MSRRSSETREAGSSQVGQLNTILPRCFFLITYCFLRSTTSSAGSVLCGHQGVIQPGVTPTFKSTLVNSLQLQFLTLKLLLIFLHPLSCYFSVCSTQLKWMSTNPGWQSPMDPTTRSQLRKYKARLDRKFTYVNWAGPEKLLRQVAERQGLD